jgi:cytochrome P450
MGLRRLSRTGRSKALQESCACAADSVSQRAHTNPLTLGENHFPAATLIVPVIKSVHRQPDLYDALESFRPERFFHPRATAPPCAPVGPIDIEVARVRVAPDPS